MSKSTLPSLRVQIDAVDQRAIHIEYRRLDHCPRPKNVPHAFIRLIRRGVRIPPSYVFVLGFGYAAFLFGAGTFAPSRRAFESPIAIACFGFVTLRPLLPDRRRPRFISCISCPTSSDAFRLYRRPLDLLPELLRDDAVVRRDADFLLRDAVLREVRPDDFRAVVFLAADLRPRPRAELADFFRELFLVAAINDLASCDIETHTRITKLRCKSVGPRSCNSRNCV